MKRLAFLIALALIALPVAAKKPCEELKAEIEAKIQAKGITKYTLEIVPAKQEVKDEKVVGTCDGGASKIVYKRG
jgi:hypothetical protein